MTSKYIKDNKILEWIHLDTFKASISSLSYTLENSLKVMAELNNDDLQDNIFQRAYLHHYVLFKMDLRAFKELLKAISKHDVDYWDNWQLDLQRFTNELKLFQYESLIEEYEEKECERKGIVTIKAEK